DSNTYHIGDTVNISFTDIPTKTGYSFVGWSDGSVTYANGGATSFIMPANNVTLEAVWSADLQVVTWDYAGGVDSNNQTNKVENTVWHTGEVISESDAPTDITKEGYT